MQNKKLIAGFTAIGLALLSIPAFAQSIDESVNQMFSSATGWFVSFIFSPFPGTAFPWIVGWLVVAATI
ncbi:MAG: sodium:alanine symporter, partial [Gammaproteobacteria bacterium]|nr:sodium:alanine symporter [Gammaproteobacteria bacterium]